MNIKQDLESNPDYKTVEDQYPRVANAIMLFWGDKEFDTVMHKFLHDTRDGGRQGFPEPAGSALLRLYMLHSRTFPSTDRDMWADAYTPR